MYSGLSLLNASPQSPREGVSLPVPLFLGTPPLFSHFAADLGALLSRRLLPSAAHKVLSSLVFLLVRHAPIIGKYPYVRNFPYLHIDMHTYAYYYLYAYVCISFMESPLRPTGSFRRNPSAPKPTCGLSAHSPASSAIPAGRSKRRILDLMA